MKNEGGRRRLTLQELMAVLAGRDEDKGGHSAVRTVGTIAVLVLLVHIAVETLAGRLIDALGLPHIPIGWLMGAFVVVSTIWVGIAGWQKRRGERQRDGD